MNRRNQITTKAYLVFLAFSVFSLAIVVKIGIIQFVKSDNLQQRLENLTTDLREIKAVRGNIYADNGNMLATSVPIYEIRMDMLADGLTDEVFDENITALSDACSDYFKDKTSEEYYEGFISAKTNGRRYYLVKAKLNYDDLVEAKSFPLWNLGRFKSGVIFEKQTVRLQPFGGLAGRTVGYKRDGVQPVGIEGAYNNDLRGRPGKRYEKRLAGGIWMPIDNSNEVEPEDGSDIHTTIDVNIQDVATTALKKQLEKHNAHHGCAVLMEVSSGRIKAIANLSILSDSSYKEIYNYAVGEATEPGSTFKLASLMAAFEDGKLVLSDSVNTENGSYRFYDRIMRDSNRKGYGTVSVLKAFQKSSNVAVSRFINDRYKEEPQEFVDRLYNLGLGQELELEISGEGSPQIKDPSDPTWSGVTLPWMSIGYETLMTPLQILTFYNAVANDGIMVRPQFVSHVTKNGVTIRSNDTEILNRAIASRETISMAKEMLESVVTKEGTASNLRGVSFTIAGKTGTAQIANSKYGYKYDQEVSYQASFVGYFPAERPEYSCIVVVNGPSNDVYYGNQVAGPVFKEIADKVYAQRFDLIKETQPIENNLAIEVPISKSGNKSDLEVIFAELNVEIENNSGEALWVETKSQRSSVAFENRTILQKSVPNVLGMSLRDGLFLLEKCGLDVSVEGKGTIKKQSLPPGSKVRTGRSIKIELS